MSPKSEFYLFIPRDEKLSEGYGRHLKVTDIFPVNSVGITTARDKLTVRWTKQEIWNTVLNFSKLEPEMARIAYDLGKDVRDWKVKLAQNDLLDSGLDKKRIVPILYRPFDVRYTYYTGRSRGFHCMPRPQVMWHMMRENLGLITNRQVNGNFMHAFCSNMVINDCAVSLETRERSYLFPLYLYPENGKKNLFTTETGHGKREANISREFVNLLFGTYKKETKPEEILYYIYAVLYSKIYRTKYTEFLRTDFPRIPFTKNYKIFSKMGEFGKELVDLHLLKSKEIDPPIAKFEGKGENKVEKVIYEEGKVSLNKDQYFDGVSEEIWKYQVGGYQVCDRWLKDRKGRVLSLDDIRHYCKVVTSIGRTIEVQQPIDEIFSEVEKETIDFKL